ncbi:DUF2138 family protein [Tahibacter amnicola]|uniref:DUF2138 family protein n=1 Tax=Tahibacter amnicola TaxID=2976241 RepID=UPI003CCCF906
MARKEQWAALFRASIGNVYQDDGGGAVESSEEEKTYSWSRSIENDFAALTPQLSLHGDWLLFSPDQALVQNALAVQEKRRPAIADTLPKDHRYTAAVITPQTLTALLGEQVQGDLPAESEPLFQNAAQRLLLPRLEAVGQFAPVAVSLPDPLATETRSWQPLLWQSLPAAR